jgi:histidinol dehydrogenase
MKVNFFKLGEMSQEQRRQLCRGRGVNLKDLIPAVMPIIEAVQARGDEAVTEFTKKFDGADMAPSQFRVRPEEMDRAVSDLPDELRDAIETSIGNIRKFHERQLELPQWEMEVSPGITAGEKIVPVDSVGLYVPRGKGSFPSMMMMAGVPAKVAGVRRIVVTTPPDESGKADMATIAAARMIGLDEVYAVGGVQAVTALACGTQTMPRVDKIVGPGSGYVLAAKQILSTEIDTGLPAGPSEAIIFSDSSTDPLTAVTDLLIEAEHGPDSSAYLVTSDETLAKKALEVIPDLVSKLPQDRKSFCETVLSANGGVVLAKDSDDAINFINGFAPEHLQILTRNPEAVLDKIKYAGEALLGSFTPGTLANYSIGPNAILPTSGFARTASALSVRDFTRRMSFARVTEEAFGKLAPKTLVLARYEGFAAHAAALALRLGKEKG